MIEIKVVALLSVYLGKTVESDIVRICRCFFFFLRWLIFANRVTSFIMRVGPHLVAFLQALVSLNFSNGA